MKLKLNKDQISTLKQALSCDADDKAFALLSAELDRQVTAKKAKKENTFKKACKKAGHYLCNYTMEAESIEDQVQHIIDHPNQDDFIDEVLFVSVWEKVEYTFTCREFLNLIGLLVEKAKIGDKEVNIIYYDNIRS